MKSSTTNPTNSAHNPTGLDGMEFVEYGHPDPAELHALFLRMGFSIAARHRTKAITVYRQGDVNFLVNEQADSHAARFIRNHGPCAPSMAFRVADAAQAYHQAIEAGAEPADPADGSKTLEVPAIKGIGGSLLYFVDRYGAHGSAYDNDFEVLESPNSIGSGLLTIDHLTHNVHRGRMEHWVSFYQRLFNFHEIRYFDIAGKMTGLHSRALASPDGKIKIPINESADDKSQIEEYLAAYKGEGIQHIALSCTDIHSTVGGLRANGLVFMPPPPDTYYEAVNDRVKDHGEDLAQLQRNGILIDGSGVFEGGYAKLLLQIFSGNVIGPIFFEFIQRKGDDGFGHGNFQALFESIEQDQIRRGVLTAAQ